MKPTRVRSQEAFARACRVIPGGVNSPARAFGAVGGQPLFIARGEGPYLYDLDGNQYLDYVGSWGPLILGHAHPRVVRAVEEAVRRGASFGAPTELETQLAELIIDAVPSIEMVRMVSSRHRGVDERHPPGARLHRPRRDRQVRRLLSRPRR